MRSDTFQRALTRGGKYLKNVRAAGKLATVWLAGMVFSLALFSMVGTGVSAQGGSWTIREVDIFQAQWTQIAIGHDGRVHVCYSMWNGILRYAHNTEPYGNWTTEDIEPGGAVRGMSMALDSNDKVHVSYFVAGSNNMVYATNAHGAFASEVIDSSPFIGYSSSIALDAAQNAHISYTKSDRIQYATNAGGSWSTTQLQDVLYMASEPSSIAIGTDGTVHIAYPASQYFAGNMTTIYRIRHAWSSGGDWENETITSNGSNTVLDLAVDNLNRPHIAYIWGDPLSSADPKLMFSQMDIAGWSTPYEIAQLPQVPSCIALIMDESNEAHMSYDVASNGLYYATSSGGWSIESVAPGLNNGRGSSIAKDADGKYFISYCNPGESYGTDRVKYATTTVLPSEPWDFKATPGSSRVSLQWNHPNSTGDYPRIGYTVDVYNLDPTNGPNHWPILSVGIPATNTTHEVTGLYNNGWYWFQVIANTKAGESVKSVVLFASPGEAPSAPSNILGMAIHNNITLTWYQPIYSNSSAVSNYSILWGLSTTTMTNEVVLGDVMTYEHHDLVPGQFYYYKVRAKNIMGWGPFTPTIGIKALGFPPSTPVNVEAIAGDSEITITWQAPPMGQLNPVSSYRIYMSYNEDQEPSVLVGTVANGTLSYTETGGVVNGERYYFAVLAVNDYGSSPLSPTTSAVPTGTPPIAEGLGDWLCVTMLLILVAAAIGFVALYWRGRRIH